LAVLIHFLGDLFAFKGGREGKKRGAGLFSDMYTQPWAVPVISLANNFLSLLFIDDRRHSSQVHWLFPDFKGGQVTKASTIQAK